jgi:hypothetical protein
MVEASRQRRDDQRRAQAEVSVQSRDKKRGVVLYGLITLGILGVGLAVFFIIGQVSKAKEEHNKGVSGIEGASLKVTVSEPKKPPPVKHTGGGRRPGGASGGNSATEDLSLNMADEGDEGTETLDMGRVYQTYSKYGGQLGGCLQSNGGGAANIYINIDGPSGKVAFVKINGKQGGALYGCMNRVLRSMKFPSINGPRTRAEFDISM